MRIIDQRTNDPYRSVLKHAIPAPIKEVDDDCSWTHCVFDINGGFWNEAIKFSTGQPNGLGNVASSDPDHDNGDCNEGLCLASKLLVVQDQPESDHCRDMSDVVQNVIQRAGP